MDLTVIVCNYTVITDRPPGRIKVTIIVANSHEEPIYEQIKTQIKASIIAGEAVEGEALPSIRALAKELTLSVVTIKRAYDELEAEGFITTHQGKGCFVAPQGDDFIREKRLAQVEALLAPAIDRAKALGIEKAELGRMLDLLYEEE
jgi:GntR family transcriptional regulator